jgi:Arc/MetJ-type ribon-helix-helix transcriptional regulator
VTPAQPSRKNVRQSDGHSVCYAVLMSVNPTRRRPKVTATLDPELLDAVDAHIAAHPELDRSAVLDDALRLWRARELERAMERQFAEPDGVPADERAAWNGLRRAASSRRLGSRK